MTPALRAADRELLLRLLRIPTVSPLEGGRGDGLWRAQHAYADAAAAIGFTVLRHACATAEDVDRPDVPLAVRAAGQSFLDEQPSLVLRLGPELARERTVMFNVHLDTVAGEEPVGFDGTRFTGRGAIDAKGPAVALLAGIRAAAPALGRDIGVLVQAVSGEEGGAMGTIGTRPLLDRGFYGAVNVFCEPTGLRYLTRATASMTARVSVRGQGAIDDRPAAGHNATVLLGSLARHFALALDDVTVCVAGLHTGELHNRVYGSGRLLLNLAYATSAEGARLERLVENAFRTGIAEFATEFAVSKQFAMTAADAASIATLDWTKRGLPCLRAEMPSALVAGIPAWPAVEPAFTCDAIWMDGRPGTGTIVLGPGELDKNNAHAEGEFAELAELDAFAAMVSRLLTGFAARTRKDPA
ncbi:M20/M25/M40 family metallo-hydrolase [Amycolatopsis minnesotensis]|uniref:Acetylornithine deacetylase/succinyl-diaminopimelate desuccinylase-like protein n=1 Tax=Amycolatopsis minnesotensis TaxID=337894 RepID=A0ABN2RRN3_9PSEU